MPQTINLLEGVFRKLLPPFCTFQLASFVSISQFWDHCMCSFPFNSSSILNIYIVIQSHFSTAKKVIISFKLLLKTDEAFQLTLELRSFRLCNTPILLVSIGEVQAWGISDKITVHKYYFTAKTLGVRLAVFLHFKPTVLK